MRLEGKTVLLVTDSGFLEERRGCAARIRGLVRALRSTGCRVHVFSTTRAARWKRSAVKRAGISSAISMNSPLRNAYLALRAHVPESLLDTVKFVFFHRRWARERARKAEGFALADFESDDVVRALSETWRELRPNVVIVEYIRLAYTLRAIGPSSITVVDTHDVMYLRQKAFEAQGIEHWLNVSEEEETARLQKFDIVVAIQQSDAEQFRRMVPDTTVVTVPPCVSLPNDYRAPPPAGASKRVLTVGSSSTANSEGLADFLDNAWPLIRRAHPDAELIVCGGVCRYFKGDEAQGMRLLGVVPDLSKQYARADVVISPVTFSGGIK
ncbi:MAG: glycosyltransferase, partial [Planctomycetota bacterium]